MSASIILNVNSVCFSAPGHSYENSLQNVALDLQRASAPFEVFWLLGCHGICPFLNIDPLKSHSAAAIDSSEI